MKIHRIINTLCLIFWSTQTISDSNLAPHYGIVNAIYTNESRIIISDTSLHYDKSTLFYNTYGGIIFDNKKTLKSGTPVKYRIYQYTSNPIVKELEIVSQKEFRRFRRKTDND